jgi:hypothetical protein
VNSNFLLTFKHALHPSTEPPAFPASKKPENLVSTLEYAKLANTEQWPLTLLDAKNILSPFTLLSTKPGPALQSTHPIIQCPPGVVTLVIKRQG